MEVVTRVTERPHTYSIRACDEDTARLIHWQAIRGSAGRRLQQGKQEVAEKRNFKVQVRRS